VLPLPPYRQGDEIRHEDVEEVGQDSVPLQIEELCIDDDVPSERPALRPFRRSGVSPGSGTFWAHRTESRAMILVDIVIQVCSD
jgi:hypothetical protein